MTTDGVPPALAALAPLAQRIAAREVVEGRELAEVGRGFVDDVLGLEFDQISFGRLTAHMVASSRHHQPFGIVHGGVWCSVVETAASVAALLHAPAGQLVVGIHQSTDFLRPFRTGQVAVVAESVHVGRSQQLWQVVLSRTDGSTLARGQLRLQHLAAT